MKIFVSIFLLFCTLFGSNFTKFIKASGNVIDIVQDRGFIIIGTDNGFVQMYDINSTKLVKNIEFEKIKDFTGKKIGAKVYSVDKINDKILSVVQDEGFYRNLYIYQNEIGKKIISKNDKLMIKKAKFIDENTILIALLSNELILYDIEHKRQIYRVFLSHSQFSDFSLNDEKTKVACASESGEILIVDVKNAKVLKKLNKNVDNVYKVDFKKDKIITAGQDRRAIVYTNDHFDRFDASFLIYACALSKSANLAAFSINQENDIAVYDLTLKQKIATLSGQKSTLNTILFIDENTLVSGSDDEFIMIWSLK